MAVAAAVAGFAAFGSAEASAETRTLSMYFPNTKESITVTYKKDGRYISSAMRKINHFLRDWRRNAVTKMDPNVVDLLWELHADLGSKKPVHIISGYRSPATNSFLKKIGRNVARKSMHMHGKAIDVTFPDVSVTKLRNSALVRQVGGVGYYPRSGKYGFVHIDTGRVRHWPRVSSSQLAKIFRDYRSTVGARLKNGVPEVQVASNASEARSVGAPNRNEERSVGAPARQQVTTGETVVAAAETPPPAAPAPAVAAAEAPAIAAPKPKEIAVAAVEVPTPRPRPMEVLAAAAADYQVTPASAPVPKANFAGKEPVDADKLGVMMASVSQDDVVSNNVSQAEYQPSPSSNGSAKGSFAASVVDGTDRDLPLIRPLQASVSGVANDLFWWPTRVFGASDTMMRLNGVPQPFKDGVNGKATTAALDLSSDDKAALDDMILNVATARRIAVAAPGTQTVVSTTKGDLQAVERSGKGDRAALKAGREASAVTPEQRLTLMVEQVLNQGSAPLRFDR